MKYRESGMPDEQMWNTFFNPNEILMQLNVDANINTLIDIGCGYGTFLIPAAKLVNDKVIGIDIENEMIEICRRKVQEHDIKNIELLMGDISTNQVQKALEKHTDKIDYITLFNILHCEQPLVLLNVAYNILNTNGKIGVIHWNYEDTPRGPSIEIRPTPEIISEWAFKARFALEKYVELPPYHYGMVFIKNQ